MAERRSRGGKAPNRSISVKISGASAKYPLGLVAEGRDCGKSGGRYYYVAAPEKKAGVLVRSEGTTLKMWKSGKTKDAPVSPTKNVDEAKAVSALEGMQKRIPNAKGLASPLKGTWRGYIECHPSGPQIVLYRDVTGYGRIVVVSEMTKGTWEVASVLTNGKWYTGGRWSSTTKAQRSKRGISTLRKAMDAGYSLVFELVQAVCGIQSAVRSPTQRKRVNAKTKVTTSRKTGKTKTTHPRKARKARSQAVKNKKITVKVKALPAALKKLIGKKAQLAVGTDGLKAGTFVKIVGAEKVGKSSFLKVQHLVNTANGKPGRLSKTKKKIHLHVTRDGKKKRTIKLGTRVNYNFGDALKRGVTTYDELVAAKKKKPAAKKASSKKASSKKASAKKKANGNGRRRLKPTSAQKKIQGRSSTYVTFGNGNKKHGRITAITPGGRNGDDWSKAKLTIEVAESGAGSAPIVISETVWRSRAGRLAPSNKSAAFMEARRAAAKKNGNGKSAAPKTRKRAASKTGGLAAAAGPPPGGSSAQAAKERFAALGL